MTDERTDVEFYRDARVSCARFRSFSGPKADPAEYELPKASAADLLLPFTCPPPLPLPAPALPPAYPYPAYYPSLWHRYAGLPYVPIYPLTYKYAADQPITHSARGDDIEKIVVPQNAQPAQGRVF